MDSTSVLEAIIIFVVAAVAIAGLVVFIKKAMKPPAYRQNNKAKESKDKDITAGLQKKMTQVRNKVPLYKLSGKGGLKKPIKKLMMIELTFLQRYYPEYAYSHVGDDGKIIIYEIVDKGDLVPKYFIKYKEMANFINSYPMK